MNGVSPRFPFLFLSSRWNYVAILEEENDSEPSRGSMGWEVQRVCGDTTSVHFAVDMADSIMVRGKDGKRVGLDLFEGGKRDVLLSSILRENKGGSAYAVCVASYCMYVLRSMWIYIGIYIMNCRR